MFIIDSGRPAATVVVRTPPAFVAPTPRQRLAGLRCEWRRLARLLADPAVELDSDEFAAVVDVYARLKAAGGTVDPMAEAFILQGCQQIAAASL